MSVTYHFRRWKAPVAMSAPWPFAYWRRWLDARLLVLRRAITESMTSLLMEAIDDDFCALVADLCPANVVELRDPDFDFALDLGTGFRP